MASTQERRPRCAAGYIRRSGASAQQDNHSPEVQRAAITELAARAGFILTLWDGDEERGRHIIQRPGYLRTLEAAQRGDVQAILVFHTSRWGRRTGEMVTRLDELDRRGVEFWSVDRGRLQPGLVSTVLFAVDEEFCRTLARGIRPARERGARGGVHQGPTPFGYLRRYLAWDGRGKRPPGEILIDPVSGPIVQEMVRRYDAGTDSCRTLARWLNEDVGISANPFFPQPSRSRRSRRSKSGSPRLIRSPSATASAISPPYPSPASANARPFQVSHK